MSTATFSTNPVSFAASVAAAYERAKKNRDAEDQGDVFVDDYEENTFYPDDPSPTSAYSGQAPTPSQNDARPQLAPDESQIRQAWNQFFPDLRGDECVELRTVGSGNAMFNSSCVAYAKTECKFAALALEANRQHSAVYFGPNPRMSVL